VIRQLSVAWPVAVDASRVEMISRPMDTRKRFRGRAAVTAAAVSIDRLTTFTPAR
jgi:hypothetical protein